ncbi:transcriptional regulator family: Fungal Specific TF [Penicillium lividum]|nr:transcriptional regulator family: Fungal Specific TF [Penicillium lividum]
MSPPRTIPLCKDSRTAIGCEADDGPLLIPLGHQTPTGNLLTLDKIKRLIGAYPQDYFLFLESERRLNPLISRASYTAIVERLNLRRSITDNLVSSFFTNIHSQFPVLDRKPFLVMFEKFLQPYQEPDISAALCLMTLALGEICTNPSATSDVESSDVDNGTEYFAHAYRILTTVETVPLQTRDILAEKHVLLVRIAWACYVLECDDLAEFHFPRSGIEVLVDELPFPEFTDSNDRNNLRFLAMCSIRKLLNRIHNTMYASNPAEPNGRTILANISGVVNASNQQSSVASLEAVNKELSRQLTAWFDSLPESIKPDLQNPNPRDIHDSQLRTRYYATRHVICRPCLVFAAQSPDTPLSEYIMANCEALLAAVFVISMAKGTPTLASLVPDFDELIEQAILCTEPWAVHYETADAILAIFKTIRRKFRIPSVQSILDGLHGAP